MPLSSQSPIVSQKQPLSDSYYYGWVSLVPGHYINGIMGFLQEVLAASSLTCFWASHIELERRGNNFFVHCDFRE